MGSTQTKNVWMGVMKATSKQTAKKYKDRHIGDYFSIESLVGYMRPQLKKLFTHSDSQLEKVWEQYDADGNDILDPEENIKLVKDYIRSMRKYLPKFIDLMIKNVHKQWESELSTEDAASLELLLDNVADDMKSSAHNICDLLLENISEVAGELFEQMDVNQDGDVDHDEFMDKFNKASRSLLRRTFSPEDLLEQSSGKSAFAVEPYE